MGMEVVLFLYIVKFVVFIRNIYGNVKLLNIKLLSLDKWLRQKKLILE